MLKSKVYNTLLLLTTFTFGSGINITSKLSAFILFAALILLINFTLIIFSEKQVMIPSKGYSSIFAFLFLFITFYTMLVRGIGFEFLGSNKSGGMFYIKLFTVLLLFIFSIKIRASDSLISALFISFFISCLLPFFSDVLFVIFGGETLFHKLIPGSTTIQFYTENQDSLLRIQSAASVAEYIVVLMLAFNPPFKDGGRINMNKANISILILALILIGLSGHRITLIGISLLIIFYYYYSFGIQKLIKPLLIGTTFILVICLFAILQFESLPPNFQRTFSFLPFTPTNDVTLNASDSLNFRVLMAAKAFIMLPDYYLIGKGFAFSNYEVDITDFFGIIDLFAEIGVFHNGLLGLLINLGVPGLLIGVALMYSLVKSTKGNTANNSSMLLERIQLVLKCRILVSITYFFFLYGDVQSNFLEIIMLGFMYKYVQYFITGKEKKTLPNESFI